MHPSLGYSLETFGTAAECFQPLLVSEMLLRQYHVVIFDQRLLHYGSSNNTGKEHGRLFFKVMRSKEETTQLWKRKKVSSEHFQHEVILLEPKMEKWFLRDLSKRKKQKKDVALEK
jgi:hypothetical protein